MSGSLNSQVVGTLRLETETSYGLRSSTVLQIVFFLKKVPRTMFAQRTLRDV